MAGLDLHRGPWIFKASFSSVLQGSKYSIIYVLGGMVLSVFESSRRDHLTSRCPDAVFQGLLGALQQAQQALSSFNTIITQEKSEKPLKPCT